MVDSRSARSCYEQLLTGLEYRNATVELLDAVIYPGSWQGKPKPDPDRQTKRTTKSNPMVLVPQWMVKGVGPVSSARPAPARPKSSRHRRVLTQMERRLFILDLVV
ncbi:hypothetical protein PENANT_c001G08041 [Penicillium antarcticum]|uniref:Uncharacterized protein n=1 Tax=Penicillium antarcticum TaxID=416450 RepID=A0A1V6QMX2_9EURO|nr:uncharacterized protein N7508_010050 [Penicillium antarcticum]KAJ5295229.1 hypothetical protein N7508_010050 [Penicillium antarcticum]OQD90579.1 hypothetical protein PENANT_c001G08041 [Penicillium antarcticum]